jgi:hypothetical protein
MLQRKSKARSQSSLMHNKKCINDAYVGSISKELIFNEDVVRERCFHKLPYSKKYLRDALDTSDVLSAPSKLSYLPLGRHNTSGTDNRHLVCFAGKKHVQTLKSKSLEELKSLNQQQTIENINLITAGDNSKFCFNSIGEISLSVFKKTLHKYAFCFK